MYNTLKESVGNNCEIISTSDYEHKGETRQEIKVFNKRSKRVATVVKYASGRYSEKVTMTKLCTNVFLNKISLDS